MALQRKQTLKGIEVNLLLEREEGFGRSHRAEFSLYSMGKRGPAARWELSALLVLATG